MGKRVNAVACGSRHTLALVSDDDGTRQVYAWGSTDGGVCGLGDAATPPQLQQEAAAVGASLPQLVPANTSARMQTTPRRVPGLATAGVTALAACGQHSLALDAGGCV